MNHPGNMSKYIDVRDGRNSINKIVWGHYNFHPDEDGVNRRTLLAMDDHGELIPSLGLRGAMAALGVDEIVQKPFEIVSPSLRWPFLPLQISSLNSR